jgi:hypothetical protein
VVFALAFPFTWCSLLIFLHVFAAVYLKCFLAISFIVRFCHSVFKAFLRIFVFRFIMELSKASRSGWNEVKLDTMNLKCFRFIHLLKKLWFTYCDAFQIHPVYLYIFMYYYYY